MLLIPIEQETIDEALRIEALIQANVKREDIPGRFDETVRLQHHIAEKVVSTILKEHHKIRG